MPTYIGNAKVKLTPSSVYSASANQTVEFPVSWSYTTCVKRWFRYEATCFRLPPTVDPDGNVCPPYPVTPDGSPCIPSSLIPVGGLFNTGVNDSGVSLNACDEDGHYLVLPAQRPFVVDPSNVPSGSTAPSSSYMYLSPSCSGLNPPNTTFALRLPFLMPLGIIPSTVVITFILDTPTSIISDIKLNNKSTGFSATAPVNALQFNIQGFNSDLNNIDFYFSTSSTGTANVPVMLMVRIKEVVGCPGNGTSGANQNCKYNMNANVLACDAEDVCRIIKLKNLKVPLTKIRLVTSGLDPLCYPDVTPTLESCEECCDLLIDEDLTDNWLADVGEYGAYEYEGIANLIVTPNSNSSIVYNYIGEASVNVIPESLFTASYFYISSEAIINVIPESISGASFLTYTSNASIIVTPEAFISSSFWSYQGQSSINVLADSLVSGGVSYQSIAQVVVIPSSINDYVISYVGNAKINAKANSDAGVTNVNYASFANISLSANSNAAQQYWNYIGVGNVLINPSSFVTYNYIGVGKIILTPNSSLSSNYSYFGNAQINIIPSSFVSNAPSWDYIGLASINVMPESTYTSSDIGLFGIDCFADAEVEDEGAVFNFVPAPLLRVFNNNLSFPGCCNLIPENLSFVHNFRQIVPFGQFLRRNSLTIPGDLGGTTVMPLLYSSRSDSWEGHFYGSGFSSTSSGFEQWSITVSVFCASPNWEIRAKILRNRDGIDEGISTRILVPIQNFCTNVFSGYAAAVNVLQEVAFPVGSAIVNDESEFLSNGPRLLYYLISIQDQAAAISSLSNLNTQYSIASNV